MSKTNIVILATYWNEIDWIEASLAQIDAIDPVEVIICDGCFDPRYENRSTDGTREIIEAWVKDRPHARMIHAKRLPRLRALWYLFGHRLSLFNIFERKLLFFYYLRTNIYRIYQAATFNKMMRMSRRWKPGTWFMTLDADQFYPDDMIESFRRICNDRDEDADLLTATEKTFFENFNEYTDGYDKRNYNNMPHRIKKDTFIVPTRDIITEHFLKPKVYGKDLKIKKKEVGSYFHYKFHPKKPERSDLGNSLGDRKKIDPSLYEMKKFEGKHPSVLRSSTSFSSQLQNSQQ